MPCILITKFNNVLKVLNNFEYKRNKILIVCCDVKKGFQNGLLAHLNVYIYLFTFVKDINTN
jgi:hypothetical protein